MMDLTESQRLSARKAAEPQSVSRIHHSTLHDSQFTIRNLQSTIRKSAIRNPQSNF
jgi:hypothetical protein